MEELILSTAASDNLILLKQKSDDVQCRPSFLLLMLFFPDDNSIQLKKS